MSSDRSWLQQIESASMQIQELQQENQALRQAGTDAMRRHYGIVTQAQMSDGLARIRTWIAVADAMMSDSPGGESAPDTTEAAVQRRVDQVCDDLIAGRTTTAQRSGLGSAVERAGRVRSGSDAAVGRAVRLVR